MKSTTAELANFLSDDNQFVIADLYSFSIQYPTWNNSTGLVFQTANYYYTSFDQTITWNGITYLATGPLIERDRVRTVLGVEVDSLSMRVYANSTMQINGVPFLVACIKGFLDGARVNLDRLYLQQDLTPVGTVNMFQGRLSPAKVSRTMAELEIRSDLELLNITMPRNLYQAGCQHTLYNAGCGLSRVAFSASASVASGSTTSSIIKSGAMGSKASGYWDLGGILFTTGPNANVMRTIKSFDGSNTLSLVNPLPYAPTVGDQFVVYAGCDKTMSTCTSKFNNVVNFKGFPYIPQPETMR